MAKFYFILFILLSSNILNAQIYVTTNDLNVRSGAGTKYEALGVLPKGSTVEVLELKGKWGKITFEGNNGYVSTKFLELTQTANVSKATDGLEDSSSAFKWILGALIFLVMIVFRNNPIFKFLFKMVGGLLSLFFSQTRSSSSGSSISRVSKYRCKLCGRTQNTDGSPERYGMMCTSGLSHDWRKVTY